MEYSWLLSQCLLSKYTVHDPHQLIPYPNMDCVGWIDLHVAEVRQQFPLMYKTRQAIRILHYYVFKVYRSK